MTPAVPPHRVMLTLLPFLLTSDWCEGLSDSDYGGCNLDSATLERVESPASPLAFGGVQNFGATLPSCYTPPAGATSALGAHQPRGSPVGVAVGCDGARQQSDWSVGTPLWLLCGVTRYCGTAWDQERFLYEAPGGKCACDQDGNNEDVFFQSLKHNAMLADAGRWMGIMMQVCVVGRLGDSPRVVIGSACVLTVLGVCSPFRTACAAQVALLAWCIYAQCARASGGSVLGSRAEWAGADDASTAPAPSSYANLRAGDGDDSSTAPKGSYGSNLA